MNYTIIEQQTTAGVTAVVTPVVKTNYYEAEQEYHTKLAYAAVSQVGIHAVAMLTERGALVKYEAYSHEEEPTEEA